MKFNDITLIDDIDIDPIDLQCYMLFSTNHEYSNIIYHNNNIKNNNT